RNRVVDFLRAAAITVVVLGHWTIMAVDADGGILPHGVLDNATWTHPLTWVFQVMPIFFLVGGYSNALSWRSARRKHVGYGQWLRTRLRRLGIPLIPLLLAWLVICVVAVAAGAAHDVVQRASQMALIPTWFLAAYLMVIMVAPLCLVLWEKLGWLSIIGGIALAGAVDALSIAADQPLLGYPNYLLVWAAFHQFGYAWLDGRLSGTGRRLQLAAIGLAGLLLLVLVGPYPVSMITSAADEIFNSNPTRLTMAFLGMLQAGLVLFLERPLTALLRRPGLWFVTVLVNQRIMTWFLWHLSAPGRPLASAARPRGPGPAACSSHPLLLCLPPSVGAGPAGGRGSGRADHGPRRRAPPRRPLGTSDVEAARRGRHRHHGIGRDGPARDRRAGRGEVVVAAAAGDGDGDVRGGSRAGGGAETS